MNKSLFVPETENRTLFFCFGPPKSGTTFLQRLLNLHPEVSCPSEHQFDFLRENFQFLFSKYNEVLKGLDARTGGQGTTLLENDTILAILRGTIEAIVISAGGGKKINGVNDNGILKNLDFFDTLFDRPKMIAIFRNPFDVAVSSWEHNKRVGDEAHMKDYSDLGEWAEACCGWFERNIGIFRRFAEGRDNTLLIKYEDLVIDKRENLIEVLRFLGASRSKNVVDAMIEESSLEAFRKSSNQPEFFRKGQVEFGRGDIPEDLRRSLMQKHQAALSGLGYGE